MILLLLVTEADCLGHQHRRVKGATNHANVAGAVTARAV
jgi:hypothetical protein